MASWERFGLILAGSAALYARIVWFVWRGQRNPRERERLRRIAVNQAGRFSDAVITAVEDRILYYSYSVGASLTPPRKTCPILAWCCPRTWID